MATQLMQRRIDAVERESPLPFWHPEIKRMFPFCSPWLKRVLSGRGNPNDIMRFWYSLPQDTRDKVIEILYPDDVPLNPIAGQG